MLKSISVAPNASATELFIQCCDANSLSRIQELSLAIRERDLDFAAAAIRFSEGPESAQGGRIGPISPHAGHPELKRRLFNASEGDLIGPFPIGDVHVLLRLDTRDYHNSG